MTDPLISKLEAAGAGSRELDGAIWYAVVERPDPGEKRDPDMVGRWPAYTTSVDAILDLIARELPGTYARIEPRFHIDGERVNFFAYLIKPRWSDWNPWDEWFDVQQGVANTPALALCAALLRATAEQ